MKSLNELKSERLTPRELDVIRVMYFGRKDDLGLSPEYFQETLNSARKKLKKK